MRQLKEFDRRISASVVRYLSGLNGAISRLQNSIVARSQRLSDTAVESGPSIHSMELKEESRRENEVERHGALNDQELKLDLKKEYGTTQWAMRLISEKIQKRLRKRVISLKIED